MSETDQTETPKRDDAWRSAKASGGPAFPEVDGDHMTWPGMTLRDWFAGQALTGLLAYTHGDLQPDYEADGTICADLLAGAARDAYRTADAMLLFRRQALLEERSQQSQARGRAK